MQVISINKKTGEITVMSERVSPHVIADKLSAIADDIEAVCDIHKIPIEIDWELGQLHVTYPKTKEAYKICAI